MNNLFNIKEKGREVLTFYPQLLFFFDKLLLNCQIFSFTMFIQSLTATWRCIMILKDICECVCVCILVSHINRLYVERGTFCTTFQSFTLIVVGRSQQGCKLTHRFPKETYLLNYCFFFYLKIPQSLCTHANQSLVKYPEFVFLRKF